MAGVAEDLPPKSTAHSYFMLWQWDGTLEHIVEAREREEREARPTAAIIGSQSAKGAQKGALRLTRKGLMRRKKVTGRKRHILVDTLGLLLNVVVPSDIQGPRRGAAGSRSTYVLPLPLQRTHLDWVVEIGKRN